MAEPFLKYRTRFTSSLKNELVPIFDKLSKDTRIPKSRLLDEAIEDLLKKHGVEIENTDKDSE
ncbi:MAG: ribbon-helix-helix domain-containing protein [Clostridia bacterium]